MSTFPHTLTDADAREVARQFGFGRDLPERLGSAGGFSGATLWRVRRAIGDVGLKALPVVDFGRHRAVAALLDQARRQHALDYVPCLLSTPGAPQSLVEHAGRYWEATDWMPGAADFHANPSAIRLNAACTAVARLHVAWARTPSTRLAHGPCPGIRRRMAAAHGWMKLVASGWRPTFVAGDPVVPWAERGWTVVCDSMPAVIDQLTPWESVSVPVQWCVCDIWHDHVLFTGDAVSGLIDFTNAKPDNVAVDLARLLGSLVGDDAPAVATALAAYEAVRPLSESERGLVPVLDRTGVVVAIANWLRWLYRDARVFENRAAVARRLAGLVRRAELSQ